LHASEVVKIKQIIVQAIYHCSTSIHESETATTMHEMLHGDPFGRQCLLAASWMQSIGTISCDTEVRGLPKHLNAKKKKKKLLHGTS